jgi:sigma-E factor negative regulatory protein RseB
VRALLRPAPILAVVFMVAGFALMLASLRIETTADRQIASDAVAGAAGVVVPTATAAAAVRAPDKSEAAAVALFARADEANREVPFAGVKVVSRWYQGEDANALVTVRNVPGKGLAVAAGEVEDGAAMHSFTEAPSSDVAEAMRRTLTSNYCLKTAGTGTVAGRAATELSATRADGSVAARFWVDDESGLLLRRVLLDAKGAKTESTSYVRIAVGEDSAPTTGAEPTPVEPWSAVDDAGLERLRSEGWPVPERLAGGLALYQVRAQAAPAANGDGEVVQLGYTDGLVAVSVFLQPGNLDREALDGYLATNVAGGEVWSRTTGNPFSVWQTSTEPEATPTATGTVGTSGDLVVSATTDSTSAPLGSVVAAWPASAPTSDGVGDHVGRGVERVTRWFDPQD